jgi:EF-P beta-lysylation protein EpmB
MITASSPTRQLSHRRWQLEMAEAITSPHELLAALSLDPSLLPAARAASATFPLRVPRAYVARMRKGDPHDPLLRQVLPLAPELEETAGFIADPLGELEALRAPGLLHKYHGRALLIATAACAVHCRYCFRREFPYAEQTSDVSRWSEAVAAIAADSSIEEVILSGGDPLSLSDARLSSLTNALSQIEHVRRLRVHTRHPIVLPSRVDEGLLRWAAGLRWPVVFVLHANHPNEIDDAVRVACANLRAAGVTLLNQTVLLKGVNDDAGTLARLSGSLFEAGVLPYYLHVLDRVRGVAHFEVGEDQARQIALQLASRLPGYLVPKLVREVAGAPAKMPLLPRMHSM